MIDLIWFDFVSCSLHDIAVSCIVCTQFVVADFDREGVIDDKVYASMRSGDYWKRNPKANRLYLVLDNISAP